MDGLERELEGQAQVLRLNVTDAVGGKLAMRYGVRGVPTFVLLNGMGEVVLRQVGTPNRAKIVAAVKRLSAP